MTWFSFRSQTKAHRLSACRLQIRFHPSFFFPSLLHEASNIQAPTKERYCGSCALLPTLPVPCKRRHHLAGWQGGFNVCNQGNKNNGFSRFSKFPSIRLSLFHPLAFSGLQQDGSVSVVVDLAFKDASCPDGKRAEIEKEKTVQVGHFLWIMISCLVMHGSYTSSTDNPLALET